MPSRYHGQSVRRPNASHTAAPGSSGLNGPTKPLPNHANPASSKRSPPATTPKDAFGAFGHNAVGQVSRPRHHASLSGQATHGSADDDSKKPAGRKAAKEPPQLNNPGQQEAFDILTGEAERQKRLRQEQLKETRARRRAEKERELAQKAEEEREQAQKDAEQRERDRMDRAEQERLLQAQREKVIAMREWKSGVAAENAASPAHSGVSKALLSTLNRRDRPLAGPRDKGSYEAPDCPKKALSSIGPRKDTPPGYTRSAVPPAAAYDAPKSAVNAGDRTVVVNYIRQSVTLNVTPQSTPKDILEDARSELGIKFELDQTMLVESFEQLGLERPLRWYEHIRDVLNSWDRDHQNRLLVEPSSTRDADLAVDDAPSEQPGDTSVSIYHSQKPGTWDKRWVTLRSDGQVLVAKSQGAEARNICHMSDFDVYFPTARQAKRLKPPKKHFFAIKSQQKSAMFLNTENFVHFFATKDREVANAWYKAVQGWRSWYLVHEMGLGGRQQPQPREVGSAPKMSFSSTRNPPKGAMLSELSSMKPLSPPGGLLGEDQPLDLAFDLQRSASKGPTNATPARPFSNRGGPPVSYPKKLTKEAPADAVLSHARPRNTSKSSIVQGLPPSSAAQPFAAGGLLGRTYSQRQKVVQQADRHPSTELGAPPLGLPGLRPLVDITSLHQEPPKHTGMGRCIPLDTLPPGGLVGAATSPEAPPGVPSPATMARPRQSSDLQRSGTVRSTRRPVDQHQPDAGAFTGGGLLALSGEGQSGRLHGRGVQCGDRAAKEPMLDIKEPSMWAPGSLLADVERHEGEDGPVLDREKRVEVATKTGEAA